MPAFLDILDMPARTIDIYQTCNERYIKPINKILAIIPGITSRIGTPKITLIIGKLIRKIRIMIVRIMLISFMYL